jgi:SAM-dependent methyltransferase
MDRLVTSARDRVWYPDAFDRDKWIQGQASKLPAGSWVLDAGAGASKYRPLFAHCRYETQDFCKYEGPIVKYVRPIDYVCDITRVPLPEASLDAIVCTEVFEHLSEPMSALREFARLLKPGGKVFLTAPLLSYLHMEPYHFYGGFTHYWYRHWLPLCGFSVDSITPVGGPGRACASICQAFYTQWSAAEKRLPFGKKIISVAFRAWAKLFAHYILPRILPRFDTWLGGQTVCHGYMVVGTRIAPVS